MDTLRRRIFNTSSDQELRTSDQEHVTGNQEPRTNDEQPETSDQEHVTGNQEPRTSDEQPETSDQEHVTGNQEPRTSDEQPETSDQEHVTGNQEPRTNDEQPETSDQEPGKGEEICVTSDQESQTREQGHELRDQGHVEYLQEIEVSENELRTRDQEHVVGDQEPEISDQAAVSRDQKHATSDQKPGILEEEPVMKDQKYGTWDHKHGIKKQNPGMVDVEHRAKDQENINGGENSNSCLVCFGVYDREMLRPRVLPCGHSLCSSCITNMIISGSIACPSCRAEHDITLVEQVPINYDLEKLIPPEADVSEALPVLLTDYLYGNFRKRLVHCHTLVHYLTLKNCIGILLSCGIVLFLYNWKTTELPIEEEITKVLEHQRQLQMSHNSDQLGRIIETFTYLDRYDEQLKMGEKNFRETVQELEAVVKECKQLIPQFQQWRDWVRKTREKGIKEQKVLVSNYECLKKATTSQEVSRAIHEARDQTITGQTWLQYCKEYVYDISIKQTLQFLEVMKFSTKLLKFDIMELLKTNITDMLQSLQKQALRELCQTELMYCEVTLDGGDRHYRHVTFQDDTIHLDSLESQLPPSRAFTLPLGELVIAVLTSKLNPVYGMVTRNSDHYFSRVLLQANEFIFDSQEEQPAPSPALILPMSELVMAVFTIKSTPVYVVVVRDSRQYYALVSFQDNRFILQSFQDHPVPDHALTLPMGKLVEALFTGSSTPVYVVMKKDSHQYFFQVLHQNTKHIISPLQDQPPPNNGVTLELADLMMTILTQKLMPVYVGLVKDSHQYSSQVLLQNGKVILPSLQEQPVPDYTLTLPYDIVRLLVDAASALTFLDIAWDGSVRGRVYIQLTGNSGRGQLFLTLCTGVQGNSYRNTELYDFSNNGITGEEIFGGNYEYKINSGGNMLPGLIHDEKQEKYEEVGLVYSLYHISEESGEFSIVTRPDRSQVHELAFGKVIKGISVVKCAVNNHYRYMIVIAECGVILPL